MIEKNIYQTFYTKKLSDEIIQIIDSLKNNNKSYQYYFFDDNEMRESINDFSSEIKKAYDALQIGAAKADLWRYLILYKNGGVYLDIDSQINYSIDNILKEEDQALISREKNYGSFVQWCLFFKKEHPLLEKIIQYVIFKILKKENVELDKITGPIIMSQAIEDYYKNLNLEQSIYNTPDIILNEKIKNVRFSGYDYERLCTFKHKYAYMLYEPYTQKIPWKVEQQKINVIKG